MSIIGFIIGLIIGTILYKLWQRFVVWRWPLRTSDHSVTSDRFWLQMHLMITVPLVFALTLFVLAVVLL